MANVTMRQMLESGVHFGHQTRYWNPKMAPYIFGERGKIHIINLEKTLPLFDAAMNYISSLVANGGTLQTPEERFGLVFVFRVFERVSYALVMKISRPVSNLDIVQTP